jgi:class 3 adenylate cyclase
LPVSQHRAASAATWSWSLQGPFRAYSRRSQHEATLAFIPFGALLYFSFAFLDVYAVPQPLLERVLWVRGSVTVALIAIPMWMHRKGPSRLTALLSVSMPALAALSVVWMSALWDRGSNDYSSGVVLCTLTFGFLARGPLHAAAASLAVLTAFVTAQLWPGPLPSAVVPTLLSYISFVAGAGILAVLQAHSAHVTRFAAFTAQQEVEALNASLESQVLERTQQLAAANAAFLRFVPSEFLRELGYEDITRARLGDACGRRLTILFSDIRNFTSLAERLGPDEVFGLLNQCLSRISPPVRHNAGFIDKYIGDAILAVFPRSPLDAIRAAAQMQQALQDAMDRQVSIGVGIHVGEVIMGTIGEERRFEATVISDAVNLAARLESLTRTLGCGVLISHDTYEELGDADRETTRRVGCFAFKGKAKPVEVWEYFANDDDAMMAHKQATRSDFQRALEAFATGDTATACRALAAIVQARPDDLTATWWLAHARQAEEADASAVAPRHVVLLDK